MGTPRTEARQPLEDALELVTTVRENLRAARLVGVPFWDDVDRSWRALTDAVNRARYGS